MPRTSDPALYRRLCEPHASIDALNAELEAFYKSVRELREKHKLPEVLVIVAANVMDDGVEYEVQSSAYNGDVRNAAYMIARAYGESIAEARAMIGKLASKAAITVDKKPC